MCRICSGIPNPIKKFITARKASFVFQILIDHYRLNCFEHQFLIFFQQINPHKTKAGFSNWSHAHTSHANDQVSVRMIICGIFRTSNFAHCLHCRFAKTDSDFCPTLRGITPCKNNDSSMKLTPKIQQNRSISFLADHNTWIFCFQRNLRASFFRKHITIHYFRF